MAQRPRVAGAVLAAASGLGAAGQSPIPPDGFKIAFIGDQGLGPAAQAVLQLIADERVDAVVHSGDFDYDDNPQAWDQQISEILGPCFPYFASVGNHDDQRFYGPGGYQEMLADRMSCLGLAWDGDLGARSTHTYQGILFVLTAPGVFGDGDLDDAPYIRDQLAASDAIWRISSWHKLMEAMQVGGKSDDTGWDVYEESRRGGAVIATAHEHSYARTHPLRNCQYQVVDSVESSFVIVRDDPDTPPDEGVTSAFRNGLAGRSIRDQQRCLPTAAPYGCTGEWGAIYAEQQGAKHGALFGVFNVDGNPRLAHFFFVDAEGTVVDDFHVEAMWGPCCWHDVDGDGAVGITDFLGLLGRWGPCP